MKRILTCAVLALLSMTASAATLVPIQLLNPTGSTAGQVIVSSGASSAPAWGGVPAANVSGLGTAATANIGTSAATVPFLNGVNTWSGVQTFSSGIAGVTNGSAAAVGNIGQVLRSDVSVGSAVSLTSANTTNITSLTLPAGDWDVWGYIATEPAGTTVQTSIVGGITPTSASLAAPLSFFNLPFTASAGAVVSAGITPFVANISTSTTYFLAISPTFTTSTNKAYGSIIARRRQ